MFVNRVVKSIRGISNKKNLRSKSSEDTDREKELFTIARQETLPSSPPLKLTTGDFNNWVTLNKLSNEVLSNAFAYFIESLTPEITSLDLKDAHSLTCWALFCNKDSKTQRVFENIIHLILSPTINGDKIEDLARIFPNLTSLTFQRDISNHEFKKILQSFPNLSHLDISMYNLYRFVYDADGNYNVSAHDHCLSDVGFEQLELQYLNLTYLNISGYRKITTKIRSNMQKYFPNLNVLLFL